MQIRFLDKRTIEFEKEISNIDKFVIDVTKIFDETNINYVIVSGYLSILFGRTRTTEDIDVFVERLDENKLKSFYEILEKRNYWIINAGNYIDAFSLLTENVAIRLAKKGWSIPNFEIKFAKNTTDMYSLERRVKVLLNGNGFYISPLEMNIAYKLFLGGNKDIEDAYHLYKLLREQLDLEELRRLIKMLNVEVIAKKSLSDLYV